MSVPADKDLVAAVVVAGGAGMRSGQSQPKQFVELNKYPLYIWSISNMLSIDSIKHIAIILPSDYIDAAKKHISIFDESKRAKLHLVAGGDTRQQSVHQGLKALVDYRPRYVIVHDGARPFAGVKSFNDCLATLKTDGPCTIGTPVSDTIKRVDQNLIVETLDRSRLWAVQTPQGAPFDLLLKCHQEAADKGLSVTDDAAIMESFGHKVTVFTGFYHNIKVTVADDFKTCELLAPLYLPKTPMQP